MFFLCLRHDVWFLVDLVVSSFECKVRQDGGLKCQVFKCFFSTELDHIIHPNYIGGGCGCGSDIDNIGKQGFVS